MVPGNVPRKDQAVSTLLTSRYLCQHPDCGEPIEQATGLPRSTLICPACSRPTSAYAVLYRCGGCQAFLETPRPVTGGPVTPPAQRCPNCRRDNVVPQDVLQRRGETFLGTDAFGVSCPNCAARLQTEKRYARARAVCPCCLFVIRVPEYGSAAALPPHRAADPVEALGRGGSSRCRHCHQAVPTRARLCPFCGERP
jgi:hypothetical protein